jgi:hypothetical protein
MNDNRFTVAADVLALFSVGSVNAGKRFLFVFNA